jgi:hypothetical protein
MLFCFMGKGWGMRTLIITHGIVIIIMAIVIIGLHPLNAMLKGKKVAQPDKVIDQLPTEDDLFISLYEAIKEESTEQISKILTHLETLNPCMPAHCIHFITALDIAASLDKPKTFEFIQEKTMSSHHSDYVLEMYAATALKMAAKTGWAHIVKKILESKTVVLSPHSIHEACCIAIMNSQEKVITIFRTYLNLEAEKALQISIEENPEKCDILASRICEIFSTDFGTY